MNKVFNYTWEILQNLVAKFVMLISKAKPLTTYKDAKVYTWVFGGGMSLGEHIFVDLKTYDANKKSHSDYIKHEYGHTLQSKMLGPLYLFVIGLPSLIWAGCFEDYRKKNKISYYDFYTEKWADKLGGVHRQ